MTRFDRCERYKKGTVIKTKDIYSEIGLNNKEFEKAKKNKNISNCIIDD